VKGLQIKLKISRNNDDPAHVKYP